MMRAFPRFRTLSSTIRTLSTSTSSSLSSFSANGSEVLRFQECGGNEGRKHSFVQWKATSCLAFASALYAGYDWLPEVASSEAGPMAGDVVDTGLDLDQAMRKVEIGLQVRVKSLDVSSSLLPPFTVSAKGQQVSVKFPVSPVCDLWHLIVDVTSQMGKLDANVGGDGKLTVSGSASAVAKVLTLEQRCARNESATPETRSRKDGLGLGPLCIWLFEPLVGEKFPEIEFLKKGYYSEEELDFIANILRLSVGDKQRDTPRSRYKRSYESEKYTENSNAALEALEAMGVKIYGRDTLARRSDRDVISWDNLSGYHEQKREIEDTVLLALRCPEVYDNIARSTRQKFESNRPRAVLFEGPPGTGKTSSARVIADQASVPLVYVPLEAVVSKYYGESEKMLGKVFDSAKKLPNGAIIFLDEIDSMAMTRDSEMHEATRRMLSVLLRQIDGFEQDSRVVVIAATNRKEDLDPALVSRFDSAITFGLPDQKTREEITAQYARHLTPSELTSIAAATEGMSGRDLRDICQQAERQWASKLIRGHEESTVAYRLPPFEEYVESARKRMISHQSQRFQHSLNRPHHNWPPSIVV